MPQVLAALTATLLALAACQPAAPTPTPAARPAATTAPGSAATATPRPAPTATPPTPATATPDPQRPAASTAAPTRPPAPSPTPRPAAPPLPLVPGGPTLLTIEGQTARWLDLAADTQRLYAAADAALYESTAGGWERRSSDGPFPNLLAAGGAVLLSGAAQSCARGGDGQPLRRSADGGRTWAPAPAPDAGGRLEARPVPTYGAEVFALDCGGVFGSADRGATFRRVLLLRDLNADAQDLALTPDGRSLYVTATTEGGTTYVLRVDRSGSGWSAPRRVYVTWGGAAVSAAPDGAVWLGTALGVLRSADGGATWQPLSQGLERTVLLADPTSGPLPPAEQAKLQRGVGVFAFAFSDAGTVHAGTADGVYAFSGRSWSRLALAGQRVTALLETTSGIFATTPSGVYQIGATG